MLILRPSFRQVPNGLVYRGPALTTLKRLWWQLVDMLPGNSRPQGHKVVLLRSESILCILSEAYGQQDCRTKDMLLVYQSHTGPVGRCWPSMM